MKFKKAGVKLSHLLNGLFMIGLIVIMFNPSAKAVVIQGLMKVGLFQPHTPEITVTTDVTAIPDLALQGADGQIIRLSDQKGKVIFLNFWATWCPPCIAEMPSINGLYEKLKDNKNVVFFMVDADHNFQKSRPFMVKHHLTLPLYQAAEPIPENYVSNSIPTTTIIDRNGKVVFHQEGSADYSNPKILAYLNSISK